MFRLLLMLAVLMALLTLGVGLLCAEEAAKWDAVPLPAKDWRGPGHYLSGIKVLVCWLIFLAWVWTSDWVNRDLQSIRKLSYLRWNPIIAGSFFGAYLLLWVVPAFWFGFPLLVIAYVAPLSTYLLYRNSQVHPSQRVLTPAHLRQRLSQRLAKVGVKMAAEARDPHEKGPPLKLLAHGGPTERDEQIRLISARQSPGMREAREILAGGLSCRATAVMLDYSPQAVALNYLVDGVWLNRENEDRQKADPALETLKLLCGLNPQDRQSRQEGTFAAEYEGTRYTATLACQGTKTGERAIVQLEEKQVRFASLEELGMRDKMQKQLNEVMDLPQGMVLFSALPANGLRTTVNVALRGTDRLMREFMAVEEETNRYEEIENVPVTTYDAAAGQTLAEVLPKVFRAEPNAVVVRDLTDGEAVGLLCHEVRNQRLIFSTIRAKDGTDALLRVLALKVPPAEFAKAVAGVLSQRLVRKLCEACKEAYAPPPEILKQLGIPEGRVPSFYRPPQKPEKVCRQCTGIGYLGRTAIFELLVVGDTVRKVLATSRKPDLLRSAARKDGMRSLQEEGVLLVAKGVTSLPELMRVLKQ
jgi:type II secretory ATPase GspE/PulE/Tfp pilus assembly ATPase PilB-like protein